MDYSPQMRYNTRGGPSAPVAQRIRALVFGTRGRRFESYPVYHCEIKPSLRPFFIYSESIQPKTS